ncbi:MAG: diphthamide synthesis protein [Nanoarchaeota archaeon]|nr:diphthamide synthesis protein [Nanoarchaeota archaeon]
MEYDLELSKVVKKINGMKAKTVCLQMPDGLKPEASKAADFLESETSAEIFIWADTCFGACDIPVLDVDLLVHFGHSKFGELRTN